MRRERVSTQLDGADAGPRSSNRAAYTSLVDPGGEWHLFGSRLFSNVDLRSSAFKRDFVHSQFHQVDAAPVFGIQVFDSQRIRNIIRVESISLIPDDDEHSLGAFAAATDMNQLASIHAIAVEYRVSYGFPKSEFNELLLSGNASRSGDQTYEPVHKR